LHIKKKQRTILDDIAACKEIAEAQKKQDQNTAALKARGNALDKVLKKALLEAAESNDAKMKAAAAKIEADKAFALNVRASYERNMDFITNRFYLPAYPGWVPVAGFTAESASFSRDNTERAFEMKFRLTDYWTEEGVPKLNAKWFALRSWLEAIGFVVAMDHGATQMSSSCGRVAARVATWLKQSGEDFMTKDTRSAVDWSVMKEANQAMFASSDCPNSRRALGYQRSLDFLQES